MAGSDASDTQPHPPRRSLNPSSENRGDVIYVLDDENQQYVVPWEVAKNWPSFEVFLREIFSRKRSGLLDDLEKGEFDVHRLPTDVVVLPSVWASSIRPGDMFMITPWYRKHWESTRSPPSRAGSLRRRVSLKRGIDAPASVVSEGFNVGRNDDEFFNGPPPDAEFVRVVRDRGDSVDREDAQIVENEGSDSEPTPPPERIRDVPVPIDDEGNELSFTVDTRYGIPPRKQDQEMGSNSDVSRKPPDRATMTTETYRITKAMNVVTDGLPSLEIHTLAGPEGHTSSSNVSVRWYHLYAEYLDWVQFKDACLGVPDLPARMQNLLKKLFLKVEEKKILKPSLNGMFVEPGTVLRADESEESSNQNDLQSVIFSCVPYFAILNTSDPPSALADRLYPARTLMQAYYPDKPVHDRDDEQAFKKFDKFANRRNAGLIHVPSLWIVNIGSQAVVTCGYRPLAPELKKSIIVVPDDTKQLSLSMKENKTTTIRLTDWDKRALIYQRDECRTYFEMERKLRELTFSPGKASNSIQLLTDTRNGLRKVTASIWPLFVSQKNVMFVDMFVTENRELNEIDKDLKLEDLQPAGLSAVPQDLLPPFFHWPTASNEKSGAEEAVPADTDRPMRCLTRVEKDIMDVGLLKSSTIGAVDKTFTSSTYYEGLPEVKFTNLLESVNSRSKPSNITNEKLSHAPFHQRYVEKYRSKLAQKTDAFIDVVCNTIKLFVSNMDQNILLRKLWGSMTNLVHVAERLAQMEACDVFSQEDLGSSWRPQFFADRSWWIRVGRASNSFPVPKGKEDFAAGVESCHQCQNHRFKSPNDALEHLRISHLEESPPSRDPSSRQFHPNTDEAKELREWITNGDQWVVESTVYGACAVLHAATKEARQHFNLLRELADGVRNEDGELSSLYTFPRKLLETFHQLVILYFAVERSLHYIEKDAKTDKKQGAFAQGTNTHKIEKNWNILRRFSYDAESPLLRAREDLCDMARSKTPKPTEERLSLSPEYICSWLMRKLIVKPVENNMTIADMYDDYLLTIEFQVNHRPGKRLLRSIKLVQEEIKILQKVTSWQTRQISNYIKVLEDTTYATRSALLPSRRIMFPLESSLLDSCLQILDMTKEDLIAEYLRCDPLSDTAKQSAEINEEDHGKAIFVFTVVTAIFLPLSFITSYLGMNTSDIRDMENSQVLFWEIAIPLTVVVMGTVLFVAYNGDDLRDVFASIYRNLTGKQSLDTPTRGVLAARHKRAMLDSSTTVNSNKREAEYGIPYTITTESLIPNSSRRLVAPNVTIYNTTSVPVPERRSEFRTLKLQEPSRLGPDRYHELAKREMEPRYLRDRTLEYGDPGYSQIPSRSYAKPASMAPSPAHYRQELTKIRMHRNYLSPETLAEFAVPYEPDPKDTDYIIVKQDLDETTLRNLHERTKDNQYEDDPYARLERERNFRRPYEDDEWYPGRSGGRGNRPIVRRTRPRRRGEDSDDEGDYQDLPDGRPGDSDDEGTGWQGTREERLPRNKGRKAYTYVRKNTTRGRDGGEEGRRYR